jgi:hypothetical protein
MGQAVWMRSDGAGRKLAQPVVSLPVRKSQKKLPEMSILGLVNSKRCKGGDQLGHTFVFIHGTGVREPAYTGSFSRIQQELTQRLGAPNVHLEHCYWGGTCGSRLWLNGASVPEADTTRAADGDDVDEYHSALWAVLRDDPFAELDLLAISMPSAEAPPGVEPPGLELYRLVQTLTAEPDALDPDRREQLKSLLDNAGANKCFEAARTELVDKYRQVIESASEPLEQFRSAIARAILTRAVQLNNQTDVAYYDGWAITGAGAARIAELLADALGGHEMGLADWTRSRVSGLIKRIATGRFRNNRGRFSEQLAPFGADVIMYQARPAEIGGFIHDALHRASEAAKARGESGELSVIAHSLGGIAAFDTLVERPITAVRRLITVGSQVPFLYELDVLHSIRLQRDQGGAIIPLPHKLPSSFPSWLNI